MKMGIIQVFIFRFSIICIFCLFFLNFLFCFFSFPYILESALFTVFHHTGLYFRRLNFYCTFSRFFHMSIVFFLQFFFICCLLLFCPYNTRRFPVFYGFGIQRSCQTNPFQDFLCFVCISELHTQKQNKIISEKERKAF